MNFYSSTTADKAASQASLSHFVNFGEFLINRDSLDLVAIWYNYRILIKIFRNNRSKLFPVWVDCSTEVVHCLVFNELECSFKLQ